MSKLLVVSSTLEELENISIWLHTSLPKVLNETKKNHILLVTQEIATNAILHGNKEDAHKNISLELSVTSQNIIVNIKDEGEQIFQLPSKEEAKEMDYLDENGRGLKLAVLLSDAIELDNHEVKLIFNR